MRWRQTESGYVPRPAEAGGRGGLGAGGLDSRRKPPCGPCAVPERPSLSRPFLLGDSSACFAFSWRRHDRLNDGPPIHPHPGRGDLRVSPRVAEGALQTQ